ncbi:MAG TPA: DNA gyrase subunit A, partial [Clostridiales bacterium]|nr:DNA gyrase subunit A [Clostridiales bacterium]
MSEEIKNENDLRVYEKTVEQVMHDSMMPFSEYVILDRALPRVEDGLKPVQRRILYSMYELGLTHDKPHKKCARIVGECLGKYHPHGDTSVYDALVRLAQSFNMSECLVDGHGNFGSVDGDSAAAMRYTEARLAPIAQEMLRDLDKDTVTFSLNFDDSLKEPDMLPGRYPNLLVNGASGIAVGLATNIPTHNITEVIDGAVAMIDNPHIKLDDLMEVIKGPDFPTGGIICKSEELKQAYETGKGKVTISAKMHIEREGDKKSIVITELPYQVNKSKLLLKINELRESKKEPYVQIADILDESDRQGLRATIKLKRDADPDRIVKLLLKHTDLQTNFGINMVVIADGKPRLMGLKEILRYYLDYQRTLIQRRTRFDLNAAKERDEILRGLLVAIQNIDEVIAIIKAAKNVNDAKDALRQRFALS